MQIDERNMWYLLFSIKEHCFIFRQGIFDLNNAEYVWYPCEFVEECCFH
jgi:hypothetical protein